MMTEVELVERIQKAVIVGNTRTGLHAVRHMFEEGFSEQDISSALLGKIRVLENYPDETRCLLLGYFQISEKVRSPLHLVVEYSDIEIIDIVTAYIPQKPWWISPWNRGKTR
jgi:hypothetical protein